MRGIKDLPGIGALAWERPHWVLVGCLTLTGMATGLAPGGTAGTLLAVIWLVGTLACALWLLAWTDHSRGHALATFPLVVAAAVISVGAVAAAGRPNSFWQSAPVLRLLLTLALAGFAWVLRHSLPRRGQGLPAGVLTAAALPAVALPLLLVLPQPGLLRGDPAVRLATFLTGEDGAAFLSQAKALLLAGELPATTTASEFVGYPPLAAQLGALPQLLLGPRGTPSDLVGAATAAVFSSWAACVLTFSAALLALLVASLQRWPDGAPTDRHWGPGRIAGLLVGAGVVALIAYSLIGALSEVQHLSLAWAGTVLVVLAVMAQPALASSPRRWFPAAAVLLVLAMAAPLAWFYGIATTLLFAAVAGGALVAGAPSRRVGWMLAGALSAGALIGLGANLSGAMAGQTPGSLLTSSGATVLIPWPPLAVLGAGTLGLAVLANRAERGSAGTPAWAWQAHFALILTLATAGGALAVALAQLLPVTTGSYARDKTAFLALMALPVVLTVLLRHVSNVDPVPGIAFTMVLGLAVSGQFVLGNALSWTARHTSAELVSRAERIIDAARAGSATPRVICVPSSTLTEMENYQCQRWLDAFGNDQATARAMRAALLSQGTPASLASAAQSGLVPAGSFYVDAAQIWKGQPTAGYDPSALP